MACNLPTLSDTIVITATPEPTPQSSDTSDSTPAGEESQPQPDPATIPDVAGSTITVISSDVGEPLDVVVYGGRGGLAPEATCFDSAPVSSPEWIFETNTFAPGDRAEWCACGLSDPSNAAVEFMRPNDGLGAPYINRSDDSCLYVGAYNSDPFLADADIPLIGSGSLTIREGGQPRLESAYETIVPNMPVGGWTTAAEAWFAGFQPGESVDVVYYSFDNESTTIPLPDQLTGRFLAQEAFRAILGNQEAATAGQTGMVFVETDIFQQQGAVIGAQGATSTPPVVRCATVLGNDLDIGCGTALADGDFPSFDDAAVVFGTGPKTVDAQPVTGEAVCPNAPISRLAVGDIARVTKTGGLPTRVRDQPTVNSDQILYLLSPGATVEIFGGPVCADGFVWWEVSGIEGDGWVTEALSANEIFLEPVN